MAQAMAPVGTLRQRLGLFVTLSVVLLLTLRYNRAASSTLSPTSIVTGPLHQIPQELELSSPASPFVAFPLARVCGETTFVPGLVFICDNNSGGPGNIRNYILTCLRYAIEAGSTALIMPRIRSRSASDLANIHLGHRDFGYLFDAKHFRAGLAAACPQLTVYDRLEDVPHVMEKVEREGLYGVDKMIERITPRQDFGSRAGCDQRDLNRHTDRFGQRFRDWLNVSTTERHLEKISIESPRLIRLNWGVLWDWEVLRDGPEFVATFGGLLRFDKDLLELARAVIAALKREARALHSNEEALQQGFLGVHLRTEEDALNEWPSFETQADAYMEEAEKQGYRGRIAYLASGSKTESQKFQDRAWTQAQIYVRTKYDLLEAYDAVRLKQLSWDQQAVVDFAVLLAADYFLGVSPSSFSINIALKRHLRTGGLYARPWRVGGAGDGLSHLVGTFKKYWDDWLFMYDGMWP
jgi:hypothetical protein